MSRWLNIPRASGDIRSWASSPRVPPYRQATQHISHGQEFLYDHLRLDDKQKQWSRLFFEKLGLPGSLAIIIGLITFALFLFLKGRGSKILPAKMSQSTVMKLESKIPLIHKIPLLKKILPMPSTPNYSIPNATQSALQSVAGTGTSIFSKLNPLKWKIFHTREISKQEDDEKYQAGESYGDPLALASSLADDLKAIGLKSKVRDLQTLVEIVKSKGKPLNDRQMTMEKIIAITASLPRQSKVRTKLTGVLIDALWGALQHPPMSYLGENFQYRTPDGSYNNPLYPNLGKAGSPYARTVPKLKHLHGVPPDPGLLFDLLMARNDDTFKENPAGVSSVLFYHATIIIHDVFRTNRFDSNISDTSSYLDLAPLYGSSLEDQLKIRTMERGLLKPDTFHERRLLGQPPGVNVMLVMYSRFHNYVADVLLKINENGRFTLAPATTPEEKQKAQAKQDNDLFQTSRLITCGLYINICLHDYLRGLTNTHHSASDWTLDPRVVVDKHFDPEGVPRGVGNQISAEFNLLYRFHSTISRRDEKWLNEFFRSLFPDVTKPLEQLTPQEFVQGLFRYERGIAEDPSKRTFGGLQRNASGKFNDADLVNVMKESMEDPAGLFGARMVPKALRIVEITGILTARKWQLASLNEMRDFFKLKRHETFEDLNPDPEIADLLRKLYDHPDMVEMYPGLFLEDAKPRMDPGCGGCPPYTVGRAVFSDAVTLVRSDRFYTLDYTASNLTNWGMREVQQDYNVLGGSMFYKLFQRAFPGWFPYNSLHIMQPMFTRKMNEQIAREIGTINRYTLADPAPPPKPVVIAKHSTVTQVLKDQANFQVPWAAALNDMIPGKDYSTFMLGADKPANTAQRNLVGDIIYGPEEFKNLLSTTALSVGKDLLQRETLILTKDLHQLDIVRDVAIPLNTRILADLFSLDLKTSENPNGSMNSATLYKHLVNVRTWGFNNNDPGMSWQRRMWAGQGAEALSASTLKAISSHTVPGKETKLGSITNFITDTISKVPVIGRMAGGTLSQKKSISAGSLRWYGKNVVKELIVSGKSPEEASEICWLSAVAGVSAPVGVFVDVLNFFLRRENSHHWWDIQEMVANSDEEATNNALRQYVLEAQRLTSTQRNVRVCVNRVTIDGQSFNAGDNVVCLFGPACKDPTAVPEPETFKLDRPRSAYIHFGYGPHECLGREITLSLVVALIKIVAQLKNVRPALGDMGSLKNITIGTERCYLNDSWSWLTFDPTTWKIHFEGYGRGVYQPPSIAVTDGRDLNALSNALVKQDQNAGQFTITGSGVNADASAGAAGGMNGLPPSGMVPAAATSGGISAASNIPPDNTARPGINGTPSDPTKPDNWFFGPESDARTSMPVPKELFSVGA